jgi:hypothetical protein
VAASEVAISWCSTCDEERHVTLWQLSAGRFNNDVGTLR